MPAVSSPVGYLGRALALKLRVKHCGEQPGNRVVVMRACRHVRHSSDIAVSAAQNTLVDAVDQDRFAVSWARVGIAPIAPHTRAFPIG